MMTEEQNREEHYANQRSREKSATSLPSRLDAHGTRKKRKKQEAETESSKESLAEAKTDYQKSPMIARVLLSLFIVLVAGILWLAFFA